ncbi:MAG: hypothetical protein WBQ73_00085 [Candidatus Babeliales bacterium]
MFLILLLFFLISTSHYVSATSHTLSPSYQEKTILSLPKQATTIHKHLNAIYNKLSFFNILYDDNGKKYLNITTDEPTPKKVFETLVSYPLPSSSFITIVTRPSPFSHG